MLISVDCHFRGPIQFRRLTIVTVSAGDGQTNSMAGLERRAHLWPRQHRNCADVEPAPAAMSLSVAPGTGAGFFGLCVMQTLVRWNSE